MLCILYYIYIYMYIHTFFLSMVSTNWAISRRPQAAPNHGDPRSSRSGVTKLLGFQMRDLVLQDEEMTLKFLHGSCHVILSSNKRINTVENGLESIEVFFFLHWPLQGLFFLAKLKHDPAIYRCLSVISCIQRWFFQSVQQAPFSAQACAVAKIWRTLASLPPGALRLLGNLSPLKSFISQVFWVWRIHTCGVCI